MTTNFALPPRPSPPILRQCIAALAAGCLFMSGVHAQAPKAAPGAPAVKAIESRVLLDASGLAYQREMARLHKDRKFDTMASHASYARQLAAPLVAPATALPYAATGWSWQIAVETRDDLAFWCLPGGNIVVSSAFFEGGRFSASELAALIAHGYAHELAGHDAAEAALRLAAHPEASNPDPNRRLLVLAGILADMVKRDPYPWIQERDADAIALDLLARAGSDPRGLAMLWKKLVLQGSPSTTHFAAVHPSWPERIADIETQLPAAMALYEKTKAEQARAEQAKPAAQPRRSSTSTGRPARPSAP